EASLFAPTRRAQLAAELWDRTLDYLHDDRLTLHSCSLVCRAWLSTTRHHLF
ncbi:hypothetical protein C8J56DRAFT_734782, partial [Mycena floridula]